MKKYLIPILLSGTFAFTSNIQAQNVFFRSNAYDLKTGQRLYSENHTEVWKNGKHSYSVVHYKDTSEKTIVKKTIYFTGSRISPTYKLEDLRTGLVEGVSRAGSNYKLFYRDNTGESLNEKVLSIPGPVVVDGGFDYFVRDNFKMLLQGKTLTGNFTVAHRLDYFQCRIMKVKEGITNGRKTVTFKMEPTNVVIRTIADAIFITYDVETKKLLVYTGASNLEGPDRKNYKVRIVFSYPEEQMKP